MVKADTQKSISHLGGKQSHKWRSLQTMLDEADVVGKLEMRGT